MGDKIEKWCGVVAGVTVLAMLLAGIFYTTPGSDAGPIWWAGVAMLVMLLSVVYGARSTDRRTVRRMREHHARLE
ncbi:hypothetical protein GII36_02155 [Candidatus Mycosynbacter amalyticus]|uniref:Uncharacterized protein n=1 Tax=Candidatus Mycosynbacter amalyticus TaxID=2665156 RepID=A0A857MNC6_9BACT|nr:hypothetical protein [Candidatus Mycosynbacter amalyticus]QHN42651.1 hypothetical protein GII36_02155 [Candidatus Mycosynbacter amalyticus]